MSAGDAPLTTPIGLVGIGSYAPPQVVSAEELAAESGIPVNILREKFGIRQVHRAGPDCHVSDMAKEAGRRALDDAGVSAEDVDLVIYCGSEYKDYIVWSAVNDIADGLGLRRAQTFEVYALCAGAPITLRLAKSLMLTEPDFETVLVVAASKESALIDRTRESTRFMNNFGDGAGAAVLRRPSSRNQILASASLSDGSFSRSVIMPAGGSRHPATARTAADGQHVFDTANLDDMRARLEEVSGPNFLRVIRDALSRSGCDRVDVLAAVHMKRSMNDWMQAALGAQRAVYLEDYGHMQAADQFVMLDEGRKHDVFRDGDVIVLAAAGVGYTWSATVMKWGDA